MDAENYYEILGVSEKASRPEIKSAYFRLIKKYHPDAAPAGKKDEFQKKAKAINSAWATLRNEKSRREYDAARSNPRGDWTFSSGPQSSGFAGDPFASVFDLFDINSGKFGARPSQSPPPRLKLQVSVLQLIRGALIEAKLPYNAKCAGCKGARRLLGQKCQNCSGTGSEYRRFAGRILVTPCQNCRGRGRAEFACNTCKGTGCESRLKKMSIGVPADSLPGDSIFVRGLKSWNPQKNSFEDLSVELAAKDGKFKVNNLDLHVDVRVSARSLADRAISVTCPLGRDKILEIPPGFNTEKRLVVKKTGLKRGSRRGDLVIKLVVSFP